jgi:hypothetical protein
MSKTTWAHFCGVAVDCPFAHVLFHASTPELLDMKQPAGTPE